MRLVSAALLLSTVILTCLVQAQDAKLAVTLGPNAAAWQVGSYQGKIDAVTIDGDGRPASAIGPNGLVVTSAAPIGTPNRTVSNLRPASQQHGGLFGPLTPGRNFRHRRLCWLQSSTAVIGRTCRNCTGPRPRSERRRKRISSWMSGANCNRLTI